MTTTDRPYTDDDLRAEAARQLALSTEDPDFMGIGERMQDSEIDSLLPPEEADGAEGTHWGDLSREDFDTAQRAIDDLLTNAADVSEWAVNLGADGLEPDDEHVDIAHGGVTGVRIHFAFHPDLPEELRASVIAAVHEETAP